MKIAKQWRAQVHDGLTHIELCETTGDGSSEWVSAGVILDSSIGEHLAACANTSARASTIAAARSSSGATQGEQTLHAVSAERDRYLELLKIIVTGDVGRQMAWKLSTGQSTDTDEGRAWLAALDTIAASSGFAAR